MKIIKAHPIPSSTNKNIGGEPIKEIKISFTISIPLRKIDIHWIGKALKKREDVFMEVMKEVIKGIEDEAIKSNELCSDCRLPLVRNGREPKMIKTLLGTLQIRRARLRCQGCGKDIYPLDKAMGIEGDCVTIGVKERALWAAVEVSY